MNAKAALDLLRKVGVRGLSGTDGCLCMSCSVQGVDIDISCRKSGACYVPGAPDFRGLLIRAHSSHMDAMYADLQDVADEVASQLADAGQEIATRLCDYRIDRGMLCAYCEKPRTDVAGYFCAKHTTEESRGWFTGGPL